MEDSIHNSIRDDVSSVSIRLQSVYLFGICSATINYFGDYIRILEVRVLVVNTHCSTSTMKLVSLKLNHFKIYFQNFLPTCLLISPIQTYGIAGFDEISL